MAKQKVLRRKSVRGKKITPAKEFEPIIVELPPLPACPECGIQGVHFCVGKPNDDPHWYVGVRRSQ